MFHLTPHPRRKAVLRSAAALTLAATLGLTAACGSDSGDSNDAASETRTGDNGEVYNGADLDFARQMIPHHAQAVQMANMTMGRPVDPAVRQLAENIRPAQSPEVQQMVEWVTGWGEEIPETPIDHSNAGHDAVMDGMDGMGDMDEFDEMPGMMSGAEMEELADASDGDFQDMWLRMMIEHHEGAIEMAQEEEDNGRYRDAVKLAEGIESAQKKEIATMEGLLG